MGVESSSNCFLEIAAEWNYAKNGSILPSMVHFGTKQKYWWKCEKGYEWEAPVVGRTKYGRGCPYCKGSKM